MTREQSQLEKFDGKLKNLKNTKVMIHVECSEDMVGKSKTNLKKKGLTDKVCNMSSLEMERNKNISEKPDVSSKSSEEKKRKDINSQHSNILKPSNDTLFLTDRRRKSECPPYIQRQNKICLLHPGTLKAKAKSIERAVDVEKSTSILHTKEDDPPESRYFNKNSKQFIKLPERSKKEGGSLHQKMCKESNIPKLEYISYEIQNKPNIDGKKQNIDLHTQSNTSLHPDKLITDSQMLRRKSETPPFQLHPETSPSLVPCERRQSEAPPAIILETPPTLHKKSMDQEKIDENRRKSVATLAFVDSQITNSIPESLNRLAIGSLNSSSGDLSENPLRSGHMDLGSFLSTVSSGSDKTHLQLNLLNCPNDSTVQCHCGHINCPCCNLLMNLEITDPAILQ